MAHKTNLEGAPGVKVSLITENLRETRKEHADRKRADLWRAGVLLISQQGWRTKSNPKTGRDRLGRPKFSNVIRAVPVCWVLELNAYYGPFSLLLTLLSFGYFADGFYLQYACVAGQPKGAHSP